MIILENVKEKIRKLIEEIDEMIENNRDKEDIENKRKELDELLDLYLKDL